MTKHAEPYEVVVARVRERIASGELQRDMGGAAVHEFWETQRALEEARVEFALDILHDKAPWTLDQITYY